LVVTGAAIRAWRTDDISAAWFIAEIPPPVGAIQLAGSQLIS